MPDLLDVKGLRASYGATQVLFDIDFRLAQGEITAINSEVDSATRNVAVQATLANPKELLRAGMFARVDVELAQREPSIVVPATAIAVVGRGEQGLLVQTGPNVREPQNRRVEIVIQ